MIPAASVSGVALSSAQTTQAAPRASQAPAPEAARASVGEAAASNVRGETVDAVKAPEQTAVAPRLRDQENTERTARAPTVDAPAGPPPAFEESPLERQARVAFDPPEFPAEPEAEAPPPPSEKDTPDEVKKDDRPAPALAEAEAPEPPPTRSEKAEASFAETKTLSEPREPSSTDVAS